MPKETKLYDILDVKPTANENEIKKVIYFKYLYFSLKNQNSFFLKRLITNLPKFIIQTK